MNEALELIRKERERQISGEGYTTEHDSKHVNGELADAAACYAMQPCQRSKIALHNSERPRLTSIRVVLDGDERDCTPIIWPFNAKDFKPTPENRLKELAKAGALILAEMERLMKESNQ